MVMNPHGRVRKKNHQKKHNQEMEFLRCVCIYKGVIEPKELPEAPCESFGSIDGRSSGPGSLTQKQVLVRIYLAKLPDPMDFGNINLHSRVGV